jgi:hypothetical protein
MAKFVRRKPNADSSLWRDTMLLQFAALKGMRHGTVSRKKAEEIAEDILEQAKGVSFPRTVTMSAQGKDLSGSLHRQSLPSLKISGARSCLSMYSPLRMPTLGRGQVNGEP